MSIEDAGYEEFDTLQEGWNWYKLKDGSKLKTRIVLIKLARGVPDEHGNITYAVNSTNLIGIMASRSLRGLGSTRAYSPQELNSSIVEDDVEYETIREEWNKYRLKNDTIISMKLTLVKVSRTSKFDANGEPIYLVNTQPIIKANLPKNMREKTVMFSSGQPPSFTV